MSNNNSSNVWFLVLGAVATFLATGTVEILKNWWVQRKVRNNYKSYARLQLNAVLRVLTKLKYSYDNNNHYLPRDIQLIEKALEPLNKIRNATVDLGNRDVQERLIDLVADLNVFLGDVSALAADENVPKVASSSKKDVISSKTLRAWVEKNTELVDLKRRLEELIKDL